MIKNLIKKFTPEFLISGYHLKLAFLGAFLYGFPSRKLSVVGITGTSGKSTVVDLTTRILEETGHRVASISSIRFKIGEREWENTLKMTMPGRLKLQKFLREAVKAGCKCAVLEVTSEGIKQYRHKFIKFNTAVFNNLSPEHIESHGGFENYKDCKGKLFRATKNTHIINLDDDNAEYFLQFPAAKKLGFSTKKDRERVSENGSLSAKIIAKDITDELSWIKFRVENIDFKLPLLGKFNVYNALAAICVGLSQGISLETCKKALEKAKGIPGRMEIVIKEPFKVIVDYAITPVALEKVYQTATRQLVNPSTNQLICVLGACGGGRDKWKRPVFGEIASEYCGEIIITNEDPYDENPMDIINQVAEGAGGKAQKILDRREAIKTALQLAKPKDVVITTGKGCEPWMCVAGGKKIPWDDRKIVKEEFQKLYGKVSNS